MAAPIIPIVKKAVTVVVSNKKLRNTVIGIVIGFIFIALMPIIFLVGFFSDDYEIDTTQIRDVIEEKEDEADDIWDEIEEKMEEAELSGIQQEDAKLLLTMALFDKRNEDDFVDDFVGCFEKDQDDDDLIDNINSKFDTEIDSQQFTDIVSSVRKKHIDKTIFVNPLTKNSTDLMLWAKYIAIKNWGCIYSTYGFVLDEELLENLSKRHPEKIGQHKTEIQNNWIGSRTVDGVGIIKSYAWYDIQTNLIKPNINGISDVTAEELYNLSTQKGLIENIPEVPGIAVYSNGELGIYIGNGKVIEAKDITQGVVETDIKQGGWTEWFYIPNINYN